MQNKTLSVCVITYNQENYIQKTLQSIFEQKLNIPIEIIISNDCSSDHIHLKIEEELKNSPDGFTIKYFNHEKNLGMMANFIFTLKQATGNYIALCEGDDYWIDENKLQKQVNILDTNPNYSMCFTNTKVLNESKITIDNKISKVENKSYKDTDLFGQWLVPTATVVFRNNLNEDSYKILLNKNVFFGDIFLFLILANKGELIGLEDYTSVYRINNNSFTNKEKSIVYYEKLFRHLNYLSVVFNGKYKPLIQSHINHQGYKLFKYYLSKYNFKAFKYIKYYFSHSS